MTTLGKIAAIALVTIAPLGAPPANKAEADSKGGPPKFSNRLAKETSPYLLMHAHNPTDWYPWGPEAFAKAKREGKLIFLSIGYSSCYWCHVMERESFNNKEVAALLNDFVCVKVDREERPDIDHIYMTALEVSGRSGGWPLSMFLTADGKPLFGGTYWPPEDRTAGGEKVPGFKSIIRLVVEAHKQKSKLIQQQADRLANDTVAALERFNRGIVLLDVDRSLVDEVVADLKEGFDKEYGGFGSKARLFRGPKFPRVPVLRFLLNEAERSKATELTSMITLTLDKMARGGIYDQIGGGFHRYSTERTWTVPHFEKMLYDNAQLTEIYARAYRLTKKSLYRRIVNETLEYVAREMMSPEGAFYSSQDAETHHEEGRFYVWSDAELDAAVPNKKDRDLARRVYGAIGPPNFDKKYYILTLPTTFVDLAKDMGMEEAEMIARVAPLKRMLFDVRNGRDHPFLNRISLTAWSGLMIGGFAEAGRALDEPKYVALAEKAAEFILEHQRTKEGRLLRSYGSQPGATPHAFGPGYLEDYACLVHGLLNLHDATGNNRWLDQAQKLTDVMIAGHKDPKYGGFFLAANDHEKLFARVKDSYDGAVPSGNGATARNFVRLWLKTADRRYRAEAEKTLKAFVGTLKENTSGHCTLAEALSMYLDTKSRKQP